MEDEEAAWKEVDSFYDTFVKKERTRIDNRKRDLESVASHSHDGAKSAKAQGKQKATVNGDDQDLTWLPSEQHLPESQRSIVGLCKSLLSIPQARGEERVVGPGSGQSLSRIEKEQAEERLKQRYADLQFNLDQIHSYVNTARAATRVAEAELDKRYRVLSMALSAKLGEGQQPSPFPSMSTSSSNAAAQTLKGYLPDNVAHPQPRSQSQDPRDLFRALAHVDSERPPQKIGDEVRRAARELQRIGEAGGAAVGARRLTLPPSGQQTPRKVPGTPRRGNTPGRDRERTPGR
jgi:kinetochore protein Mis13/DSN1